MRQVIMGAIVIVMASTLRYPLDLIQLSAGLLLMIVGIVKITKRPPTQKK